MPPTIDPNTRITQATPRFYRWPGCWLRRGNDLTGILRFSLNEHSVKNHVWAISLGVWVTGICSSISTFWECWGRRSSLSGASQSCWKCPFTLISTKIFLWRQSSFQCPSLFSPTSASLPNWCWSQASECYPSYIYEHLPFLQLNTVRVCGLY